MTRAVLRRGLAALAPDAAPAEGGCWTTNVDGPALAYSLPRLLRKLGLQGKLLYGVGISSGGVMLDALATTYEISFAGLHYQVSPGGASGVGKPGTFASHPHPRTSFVFMTKDLFAPRITIDAAAAALRKRGTPVQVFEAKPKPITELVSRAPLVGVSPDFMRRVVQRLYDLGFLESRCKGCKKGVVKKGKHLWLEFGFSDSAVSSICMNQALGPTIWPCRAFSEEVHVVEGVHGPTAEHFEESLDFLQGASNA